MKISPSKQHQIILRVLAKAKQHYELLVRGEEVEQAEQELRDVQ